MYAYYKKLVYFSTECVFAPNAYRGHARTLLKDLEKIDASIIMNIIHSGENLMINEKINLPTITKCDRCNYVSSQKLCKACTLLEGLNRGLPKLGIGKSSRVNRMLKEVNSKCNTKDKCLSCHCSKAKPSVKTDIDLNATKKLIEQLNL